MRERVPDCIRVPPSHTSLRAISAHVGIRTGALDTCIGRRQVEIVESHLVRRERVRWAFPRTVRSAEVSQLTAPARRVEFELMRPQEIAEERARCPLVFVPLGPLEWHGPHLPLGTDGLVAYAVAVEVARRVGGVVLPAYFVGTDTVRPEGGGPQSTGALGFDDGVRIFGMDYPHNPVKSVYFEEGVTAVVVRELLRGLKANGYRLLVLVSGHGAPNHVRMLARLAAEESDPPRARVIYARGPLPASLNVPDPGHAERVETSVVMALWGDRADVSTLPPKGTPLRYPDFGIVDGKAFDGDPTADFTLRPESDPRDATAELGRRILEARIGRLAEVVQSHLGGMSPAR
jgi:creatinine amidohydrolase